jgi:hypothetical protein
VPDPRRPRAFRLGHPRPGRRRLRPSLDALHHAGRARPLHRRSPPGPSRPLPANPARRPAPNHQARHPSSPDRPDGGDDGTQPIQPPHAARGNRPARPPDPSQHRPDRRLATPTPTANPATANPATANPATANPATANPATANPATANPATTDPATTDPATTDPASVGSHPANPRSVTPPKHPTSTIQRASTQSVRPVSTTHAGNARSGSARGTT